MSQFYDDMAATAREMIAEFGAAVDLVATSGTVDPVDGEATGGAVTTQPTRGIFLSMTVAHIRDALAEGAERMVLIDNTVAPLLSHVFKAGAKSWGIVRIDSIDPAGTPLAYVLHLRK